MSISITAFFFKIRMPPKVRRIVVTDEKEKYCNDGIKRMPVKTWSDLSEITASHALAEPATAAYNVTESRPAFTPPDFATTRPFAISDKIITWPALTLQNFTSDKPSDTAADAEIPASNRPEIESENTTLPSAILDSQDECDESDADS